MASNFPRLRRRRRGAAALAGTALGLLLLAVLATPGRSAPGPRIPVLIVGGSAAAGWRDAAGHGYVRRGLGQYARRAGLRLTITNRAIPGARVVSGRTRRHLAGWIRQLGRHALAVLAWGTLNDLAHHTPRTAMGEALARQIRTALAARAVVLVVTPAVTRASYREDRTREPAAVRQEIQVARRFPPSDVYVANVFSAMKQYLRVHHLAYGGLMAGHWHPNAAGHRLAAALLADALGRLWAPPAGIPTALRPPPPRPTGRAADLIG